MEKIVVFDMDDTLFPEREFVRSGFGAVDGFLLKEFGFSGFFSRAWGLFNAGERGNIFNQVLNDTQEIECTETLVKRMLEVYRTHIPTIELFEDAKWALEYYSTQVPLALVSDGYLQTQKNKASALKIGDFFQRMYFTDQWGRQCWKPSTCAFLKVQRDLGATTNKYVYISDNPSKDFVAPNELGWETIHIKRNDGEYAESNTPKGGQPRQVIHSLYDLESVLFV